MDQAEIPLIVLYRFPRPALFTPTSCSWLNAVEGSSPNLPSGDQTAVSSDGWSISKPPSTVLSRRQTMIPKPYTWTADPDQIIAAVRRGHQMLNSIH